MGLGVEGVVAQPQSAGLAWVRPWVGYPALEGRARGKKRQRVGMERGRKKEDERLSVDL